MASITKIAAGKYRARYRSPDGGSRSRTFARKVDAEQFLVKVEGEKLVGTYAEPRLRRMTLAAYGAEWLERMRPSWRPSTFKAVEISVRKTLRVDRQLVTAKGRTTLEAPKTASSFRTIPQAGFVVEALAAHIAEHGTGENGLVLHMPDGRPVDSNRFGAVWRSARKTAGAPAVDYHDCRHTFASTLLSQGVSVKAVADWLGHASPVVTLDTYAHLMPVDEDRARTVIQAALASSVSNLCHEAAARP